MFQVLITLATYRDWLVLGVSLLRQNSGSGESFLQRNLDVHLGEVMNFHLTALLEYLWQKGRQLLVDVLDIP